MNEEQKKEFDLALGIIMGMVKTNPEISTNAWISVFNYIQALTAYKDNVSYKAFKGHLMDSCRFYKYLWDQEKECQK